MVYQIHQSPGGEYLLIKGQKLKPGKNGALENCFELTTIAIPINELDNFIELRKKGLTGITSYNPPVPEANSKDKESA